MRCGQSRMSLKTLSFCRATVTCSAPIDSIASPRAVASEVAIENLERVSQEINEAILSRCTWCEVGPSVPFNRTKKGGINNS